MHYHTKKNRLSLIGLFFCVFIFFTHYTSPSSDDYPLLIMKNPNVVIFPSVNKKEVSSFLNSYEEKMNELCQEKDKKYFFIFLGVAVYFVIANILNQWAKKITQQKYYDLLFLEEKEINAIVEGKISISLDDMLLIKNLYENIIKVEKYYYFMLFFAFFPFLHYNLKYILFNKNLLFLNVKKIYKGISIK